jgi:hypothetical protein
MENNATLSIIVPVLSKSLYAADTLQSSLVGSDPRNLRGAVLPSLLAWPDSCFPGVGFPPLLGFRRGSTRMGSLTLPVSGSPQEKMPGTAQKACAVGCPLHWVVRRARSRLWAFGELGSIPKFSPFLKTAGARS